MSRLKILCRGRLSGRRIEYDAIQCLLVMKSGKEAASEYFKRAKLRLLQIWVKLRLLKRIASHSRCVPPVPATKGQKMLLEIAR